MDYSTVSRAELVRELLAPSVGIETSYVGELQALQPTDTAVQQILAHRLGVARELLLRDLHEDLRDSPIMSSPQALRDWLRLRCAGLEHEIFLVVYLDCRHRVIDMEELFRGTLTQTSVYPREVIKSALAHNAAAIAIAHNHPSSGQPRPSRADEVLTQTLRSALALVDVRLIDHFVVSGDEVVSFAECGLL
ncbi:DNA repair protein RadC [Cupriavidus basilensis]|uniref:DNA repair protein RadC n=1 Tax=Cupriavidus basilensis TaxID=68895 RepID=A0ABT6AFU0_9BURK|nr:DNA repair protein RadC [Cupriavidus basilensis]MDF3831460.1 DNA repair protein RadC [Cupriavidus basilensis]